APLSQAREVRQYVEEKLRVVTDPYEQQGQSLVTSVQGNIDGTKVEAQGRLTEERSLSANDIVKEWRVAIGEIPGIRSLTCDAERGGGPSGGAGLTVEMNGSNTRLLEAASEELAGYMQDRKSTR